MPSPKIKQEKTESPDPPTNAVPAHPNPAVRSHIYLTVQITYVIKLFNG